MIPAKALAALLQQFQDVDAALSGVQHLVPESCALRDDALSLKGLLVDALAKNPVALPRASATLSRVREQLQTLHQDVVPPTELQSSKMTLASLMREVHSRRSEMFFKSRAAAAPPEDFCRRESFGENLDVEVATRLRHVRHLLQLCYEGSETAFMSLRKLCRGMDVRMMTRMKASAALKKEIRVVCDAADFADAAAKLAAARQKLFLELEIPEEDVDVAGVLKRSVLLGAFGNITVQLRKVTPVPKRKSSTSPNPDLCHAILTQCDLSSQSDFIARVFGWSIARVGADSDALCKVVERAACGSLHGFLQSCNGTSFFCHDIPSLDNKTGISHSSIVTILHEAACAMEFLHAKGVVHRDLRPKAVMLCSGLRPKLSDFGVAREIKDAEYAAPEICSGLKEQNKRLAFSEASDTFSFGVMMYKVLQKCFGTGFLRTNLGERLEIVWQRCKSQSPQDRYSIQCDTLSDALRNMLDEVGGNPREVGGNAANAIAFQRLFNAVAETTLRKTLQAFDARNFDGQEMKEFLSFEIDVEAQSDEEKEGLTLEVAIQEKDVRAVVKLMHDDVTDVQTQTSGCAGIAVLAGDEAVMDCEVFMAVGAAKAVISAMKRFPTCYSIQESGTAALQLILLKASEMRVYIDRLFRWGVGETVTAAMANFSSHVILQRHGISTIRLLTAGASSASLDKMVHAGSCEAILGAMQTLKEDELVAGLGCAAIRNLCGKGGLGADRRCEHLFALRAGAHIVAVMSAHLENASVQYYGCSCIRTLAGGSTALQSRLDSLVNDGAGGVLVAAMQKHLADDYFCDRACRAIANLSFGSGARKVRLLNAKVGDALVQAMNEHKRVSGVQQFGCWAIANLAAGTDDAHVRHTLLMTAEQDAAAAVISAMQEHVDDPGVQDFACAALANLAGGDDAVAGQETKDRLLELGAGAAIVRALAVHLTVVGVQENACLAIANLALGSVQRKETLVRLKAGEAALAARAAHPQIGSIQHRAKLALADLGMPVQSMMQKREKQSEPRKKRAAKRPPIHPKRESIETP